MKAYFNNHVTDEGYAFIDCNENWAVPMTLSYSRLRAASAVADTGSYAAAARLVGVSQPAVAQAVRELEAAYAVRLFQRHGGSLRATPAGRRIADIGARADMLFAEAERVLRQHADLESGEVRIGLGNAMPGMALIGAFQKDYPSIAIKVELGSHAQIMRALLSGEVDVAVLPDIPADGRFSIQPLVEQEVVAIVPLDHPLARLASVDLDLLARQRLIFRSAGSATQRAIDAAFRGAGLSPQPVITLDTREGVYEAVANGLGIGFVWRHGTSRQDATRRVSLEGMAARRHLEVVFALNEALSPIVSAFMAAARQFHRRHA